MTDTLAPPAAGLSPAGRASPLCWERRGEGAGLSLGHLKLSRYVVKRLASPSLPAEGVPNDVSRLRLRSL